MILDKSDNINFNVKVNDQNQLIILNRDFFEKYYLLIKYDILQKKTFMGFKRILPSDFYLDGIWKYSLLLLLMLILL